MALASDTRPHFTTIADFISSLADEITSVFRDILTVCYAEGLIGNKMFAVDGCKISSNCSKEWSGTRKELLKKAEKIEQSVRFLVRRHRQEDETAAEAGQRDKEKRTIETLRAKAKKIRSWLQHNEDGIGARGTAIKSNITDNESAKMPSSHGVIQGYNGIATVADKYQVVMDAQAFGDGHEAKHLEAVVGSVKQTLEAVEGKEGSINEVVFTADSGFHSEDSMSKLLQHGIDAYVADNRFRQRDPRFTCQQEHKKKTTDRRRTSRVRKYFSVDDFSFDESTGMLLCPPGKPLKSSCPNWRDKNKGYTGTTYKGFKQNCSVCELRNRCIRKTGTQVRQVTNIISGRFYYSRRKGTAEPVFANIRHILGMDRFTLRGRAKIDVQWKLFCIVHNIGKITRFATT